MKLRIKTVGVILVTLGVLFTVFYAFFSITLDKGFSQLEEREAGINVNRVRETILAETVNLENKMKDWTSWDDTYKYIEDHNEAYEKSNLISATLSNLTLNMIVYVDARGRIVFSKMIDLKTNEVSPVKEELLKSLLADRRLMHGADDNKTRNGLIMVGSIPLILSSQPILTSESKGPVRGSMIVGRFINDQMMERIARVSHLRLELLPWGALDTSTEDLRVAKEKLMERADQAFIAPLSEKAFAGYTLFSDMNDRPCFLIKMTMDREIRDLSKATIFTLLGSILVAGLSLLGVIVFILNKSVLNRILTLNRRFKEIREKGDLGLRVNAIGRDEINELGREINRTLDSLERNKNSIMLLLDNVNQGFLSFDAFGLIGPRTSKTARDIFGFDPHGNHVSSLFEQDRGKWEEIVGVLFEKGSRFEVTSGLLPRAREIKGRAIEFSYRPVLGKAGELEHVLMVATDVTVIRRLEEEKNRAHELNQSLIRILGSKNDFKDLVYDIKELGQSAGHKDLFRGQLHTIKGNLSYFGPRELVKACHQWEEELDHVSCEKVALDLQKRMASFLERHQQILNINFDEPKTVTVPIPQLREVIRAGEETHAPSPVLVDLHNLLKVPLSQRLSILELAAARQAEKRERKVNPIVWSGNLLVDIDGFEELFKSFIHIIQNVIDHGQESPEERKGLGKDEAGTLRIHGELKDGMYHISFEDDGRGIEPDKIRSTAVKKGIPLAAGITDDEVVDLIFTLGFSTKEEITETAGRGVGLAAVRLEARKLGGDVKVVTETKLGMKMVVWFRPEESSKSLSMDKSAQQYGRNHGKNL